MARVPFVVWTVVYTQKGNDMRKNNARASSPDIRWFNLRFFYLLHGVMTPKVVKKWQRDNVIIATGISVEGEDFHEGDGYDIQWFISWFQENGFDVDTANDDQEKFTLNLFPQSDFS